MSSTPNLHTAGKNRLTSTALTALTWLLTLVLFFPVAWMIATSLKTEVDAYTDPPRFFFKPTLDSYRAVVERDFFPFLLNSLMASLISVLLVLILGTATAYGLVVRPVKKTKNVTSFYLSTRMLPVAAGIVPLYLLVRDIGLLDNIWVLVILYTAMNLPIGVWMLRSFFAEVPTEILEAARVDGAGRLREVWSVLLPISLPGMASAALICFIFAWNEFFLAVNLTSTIASTVPIYLSGFITGRGLFWAKLSAAATLVSLPVIIAGWVAQKRLVQGLSLGAVK